MRHGQGEVTELHLFYNRPTSGAAYAPVGQRLLPLDGNWRRKLSELPWSPSITGKGAASRRMPTSHGENGCGCASRINGHGLFGSGALGSARAYPGSERPRQQSSRGPACRQHCRVPQQHVQRLEIGTVKLQHRYTRQTRERAPHKPRSDGIYGKATT